MTVADRNEKVQFECHSQPTVDANVFTDQPFYSP